MQPDYWTKATRHLSRQCPTMKGLIKRYEGETLRARGDAFYTLIRAISGQQISVKAADSIWARVTEVVKPLTPKKLLATPDETLRACGFSGSKVAYARNVAQFFVDHKVGKNYWDMLEDDEIIKQLTSIKGIGSWTAEMFLIFHLMRPDVLPLKDLGLLKAIHLHYLPPAKTKGPAWLKPKEYEAISASWAPYRTVATWYLWRALDPVPVEY